MAALEVQYSRPPLCLRAPDCIKHPVMYANLGNRVFCLLIAPVDPFGRCRGRSYNLGIQILAFGKALSPQRRYPEVTCEWRDDRRTSARPLLYQVLNAVETSYRRIAIKPQNPGRHGDIECRSFPFHRASDDRTCKDTAHTFSCATGPLFYPHYVTRSCECFRALFDIRYSHLTCIRRICFRSRLCCPSPRSFHQCP